MVAWGHTVKLTGLTRAYPFSPWWVSQTLRSYIQRRTRLAPKHLYPKTISHIPVATVDRRPDASLAVFASPRKRSGPNASYSSASSSGRERAAASASGQLEILLTTVCQANGGAPLIALASTYLFHVPGCGIDMGYVSRRFPAISSTSESNYIAWVVIASITTR